MSRGEAASAIRFAMRLGCDVVRGRAFLAGALSAAALAVSVSTATGAPDDGQVLVAKGHVGSHHWFVVAEPDGRRRGICFQIGLFNGRPRRGVDVVGQCSAPAVRRGIVLVEVGPDRSPGQPVLTVVGAAFDPEVAKVEVTALDGSVEMLDPHRLGRERTGGSQVGAFRYLAFAVRGPWCVDRLVTLDRDGDSLWEADWQELVDFRSLYDRDRICPQA
jgi:hypothetical protein